MKNQEWKLGHRPALDGLRGLSFILVLLAHMDLPWFNLRGGFIGVHFFFVLSGFLITTLLLEEWSRAGSISLGSFYMRRALRLLPALVLFLAGCVAVSTILMPRDFTKATLESAAIALLYSSNWFIIAGKFPSPHFLDHLWSLSVEEHFYIVWPVALSLLLRLSRNRSRVAWAVFAGIVGLALWRAFLMGTTNDRVRVYFGSDTNADGLLMGALISLLVKSGKYPKSNRAVNVAYGAGIMCLFLTVTALFKLTPYVSGSLDYFVHMGGIMLVDAAAGALVVALLFSPLRTLFEHAPLVWVGRVSYGLYLWHMPAIRMFRGCFPAMDYWADVLGAVVTFLIAALSFYALERPVLGLKKRFHRGSIQPSEVWAAASRSF